MKYSISETRKCGLSDHTNHRPRHFFFRLFRFLSTVRGRRGTGPRQNNQIGRRSTSIVFKSCRKMMALIKPFVVICPLGTYCSFVWVRYTYEVKCSQRHLLVDFENSWFGAPCKLNEIKIYLSCLHVSAWTHNLICHRSRSVWMWFEHCTPEKFEKHDKCKELSKKDLV